MPTMRETVMRVREGSPNVIYMDGYQAEYARSIEDSDDFWLSFTRKEIVWEIEPTIGLEGSFEDIAMNPLSWFKDGKRNVTESCLDRNLKNRSDKIAIIWEGDEPGDCRRITYGELYRDVCRTANAMSELGVSKGDRVIIYMAWFQSCAAMLACARLGAIHSAVFGDSPQKHSETESLTY